MVIFHSHSYVSLLEGKMMLINHFATLWHHFTTSSHLGTGIGFQQTSVFQPLRAFQGHLAVDSVPLRAIQRVIGYSLSKKYAMYE